MNFLVGDNAIVDEREKRQRYDRGSALTLSLLLLRLFMQHLINLSTLPYPIVRWSEKLFDVIISDSCKPNFQEDGDQPLYAVNPEDDSLSLVQCDGGQYAHGGHKEIITEKGNHIFQGGNWQHLHAMLGLRSGDKVRSSTIITRACICYFVSYRWQFLTVAECRSG